MKNLLLASALLFSLSAFSQQLPLKIVNNSSSPIPVVLYFYGDGPWSPGGNECDECHTSFSTDIFTVPAGNSILLDAYTDFNSSSAQAPITPGVFPTTIYIHGGSTCSTTPCTGTQAGAICALFGTTVPIWTLIEFWPPSGYHTKIGDQSAFGGCMPSTFWNDPNSTFSVSWQIFSTQIVVLFDD